MMCYSPLGYIIFSLRKLKFYVGRIWESGAGLPKHLYSDSYLGKMTIGDKYVSKGVWLFINQTMFVSKTTY